jgi:hypothetical protein
VSKQQHATNDADQQRGRRMTLSQVVERLLDRGGSAHSSVDLGLSTGGKVTIAVSIRTSPDGEATTAAEASTLAEQLFDTLRAKYEVAPPADTSTSYGDA